MSVIIRAGGNIGPFSAIETLEDRLRCDGADYPFSVLGEYTISEDDSLAPEPLPPTPPSVGELKRTGILILGVMCSATKDDQMGLTAVGLDYSMTTAGGGTFGSTKFEFSNGNTLVITADNFATIYNLWVPFRRSFFTP